MDREATNQPLSPLFFISTEEFCSGSYLVNQSPALLQGSKERVVI
jgi:hypothetical protein